MNKTCGAKPCNACPFRKKAVPGWLGGASPERFALQILADVRLPCHSTIDYEDPHWQDKWEAGAGQLCAGALVMMANINKLSRDHDVPKRKRSTTVFASLDEFIAHHRRNHARSWSDEEDARGKAAWNRVRNARWAAAAVLQALLDPEPEYLESVRNPGKDDGCCALCTRPGLDEEQRCFGCGYLVCEDCDITQPEGLHFVVEHGDEDE